MFSCILLLPLFLSSISSSTEEKLIGQLRGIEEARDCFLSKKRVTPSALQSLQDLTSYFSQENFAKAKDFSPILSKIRVLYGQYQELHKENSKLFTHLVDNKMFPNHPPLSEDDRNVQIPNAKLISDNWEEFIKISENLDTQHILDSVTVLLTDALEIRKNFRFNIAQPLSNNFNTIFYDFKMLGGTNDNQLLKLLAEISEEYKVWQAKQVLKPFRNDDEIKLFGYHWKLYYLFHCNDDFPCDLRQCQLGLYYELFTLTLYSVNQLIELLVSIVIGIIHIHQGHSRFPLTEPQLELTQGCCFLLLELPTIQPRENVLEFLAELVIEDKSVDFSNSWIGIYPTADDGSLIDITDHHFFGWSINDYEVDPVLIKENRSVAKKLYQLTEFVSIEIMTRALTLYQSSVANCKKLHCFDYTPVEGKDVFFKDPNNKPYQLVKSIQFSLDLIGEKVQGKIESAFVSKLLLNLLSNINVCFVARHMDIPGICEIFDKDTLINLMMCGNLRTESALSVLGANSLDKDERKYCLRYIMVKDDSNLPTNWFINWPLWSDLVLSPGIDELPIHVMNELDKRIQLVVTDPYEYRHQEEVEFLDAYRKELHRPELRSEIFDAPYIVLGIPIEMDIEHNQRAIIMAMKLYFIHRKDSNIKMKYAEYLSDSLKNLGDFHFTLSEIQLFSEYLSYSKDHLNEDDLQFVETLELFIKCNLENYLKSLQTYDLKSLQLFEALVNYYVTEVCDYFKFLRKIINDGHYGTFPFTNFFSAAKFLCTWETFTEPKIFYRTIIPLVIEARSLKEEANTD